MSVRSVAPPHTRGSTQPVLRLAGGRPGSPAHAGIDPPSGGGVVDGGRLPRTRGDRPAFLRKGVDDGLAPPHTRGSTADPLLLAPVPVGSPAHAGIDPRRPRQCHLAERLPRTRGDRPLSRNWWATHPAAPPHTRGSTRVSHWSAPLDPGSPAHAGIDPGRTHCVSRPYGLPRTRGDRPPLSPASTATPWAPPHTRGSTRFRSG